MNRRSVLFFSQLVIVNFLVCHASIFSPSEEIIWNTEKFPGTELRGRNFSWSIFWDDNLNVLRIVSTKYQNDKSVSVKNVWSSNSGKPFVGCAYSFSFTDGPVAEQYGGNFKIQRNPDIVSHLQTIENFSLLPEHVILRGQISIKKFPLLLSNINLSYELKIHLVKFNSQIGMDLRLLNSTKEMANIQSAKLSFLWISAMSSKDERFYGFGHQYSYIDMKGKLVPIITREQGNGRGLEPLTTLQNLFMHYGGGSWDTTYIAVPQYVTSKLSSLYLENYDVCFFDLRNDDLSRIFVESENLYARIIHGTSFFDIIESYTQYTGRMNALPEWITNGSVVGMEGGESFVLSVYQKLVDFDVPISAFWLQDWVGLRDAPWGKALWWNWESDDESYPNWPSFVQSFRRKGIRMMTYVNPMFANVTGSKRYRRSLYDEVLKNNFSTRFADGTLEQIYVNALFLDLYNPEAREWMKNVIKENVLAGGVTGYMCDFGEAYPLNALRSLHDETNYSTSTQLHNAYPEEWAKLNWEISQELPDEEIVFFMRSGTAKSMKYTPLMWLGDQMVTWDEYDGIKSAVVALLHSGFSGFSLEHTDIGGYQAVNQMGFHYVRSKELFLRWTEMAVFSAVFRTHYGSDPDMNWQLNSDNETLQYYALFSKMYVAWKDYRSELIREASQNGTPVNRHLIWHYPDDSNVFDLKYQYTIGPEWIFAPVLDQGANTVRIYLPQGSWIHVWSHKSYQGKSWYTIDAPLGQPCLFYKAGTLNGPKFLNTFNALMARKGVQGETS